MNELLSLPNAGPIRRLLALAYDLLMVAAISLVYVLIASFLTIVFTPLEVGDSVEIYDQLWYQLGFVLVNGLFFVYFWRRGGQTIGMRAWRLKLVAAESGNSPDLNQCLQRCIAAPIMVALAGIGYWWCWIDQEGRAVQDKLTQTRVLVLPKIKKKRNTNMSER